MSVGPFGYLRFCGGGGGRRKGYSVCAPAGRDVFSGPITTLEQINRVVNIAIANLDDHPTDTWIWGADLRPWRQAVGDCDEFVLAKWRRCEEAGVPVGAMRLGAGYTRRGIGHLVLGVVRTDTVWILDNLRDRIYRVADLTHDIRQVRHPSGRWMASWGVGAPT